MSVELKSIATPSPASPSSSSPNHHLDAVGYVTTVGHVIRERFPKPPDTIVAAMVMNQISDFYREVDTEQDVVIDPVYLLTSAGLGIYRQTLCFVLAMAAHQLFPERKVIRIEHGFGVESSGSSVAYYCMFADHCKVSDEDVSLINTRMSEIVKANLPITQKVMTADRAKQYFEKNGHMYAAQYLDSRSFPLIKLNKCGDFYTLCHSDRDRLVAPSTGILSLYRISSYGNGILLHFPSLVSSDSQPPRLELLPFVANPKVAATYDKDNLWAAALNVDSVGDVNSFIVDGNCRELVHFCEALQDTRIVDVARMIRERGNSVRLVLVAGPSASGKTTFAAKLRVQLTACGFRPVMFSTDDYYRSSKEPDYPKSPDGQPDHDNIRALRLETLNDHLTRLLAGETVEAPLFDMVHEQPKSKGKMMKLGKDDILIAEGIFSLHPDLTKLVPPEQKFHIYIAPMSQLNLDEGHFMSNQLLRLVRRISRDFLHRGHDAQNTIFRWPSVRRGEERNIFAYINNADCVFNSSLDYELPVLKVHVEPLLEKVKPFCPEYEMARQLLGLLKMFHPMPETYVPSTSLLREFIGQSDYE